MKRTMHRILLAAALLAASAAGGWALGDPERGDYKPVTGSENWDAVLDIAGRKAGKYNLVVRGTDVAGNVRYEGPFNVFIDPASDLPVVHISHPTAGARVGTLLHVVGTCVDDDGVKSVTVQLDDRDPVAAEGSSFWSFTLDVKDILDGEHTLAAKGTDVNGVEGRIQSVKFQIDKKAPTIRVTTHASGAIVTGLATFGGEAEDANGLSSLAVSRDAGKEWEPLKLDLDKPGRRGTFRVGMDTRKLPDGPQVLTFRAADRTGSVGHYSFLLFVNNDAPQLEVLSPVDDSSVHGTVLVAGRAADKIGLKSLAYEVAGGVSGTVDLVPGNAVWTHDLDLSAAKAGTLQVTYTLVNLTGNTEVRRLRLKVDPEKDRPVLTLAVPQKGARVEEPVMVAGFVRDDDALDRVEYSLDGGAPVTVTAASASAFSFSIPDAAPGAHKLVLRAFDTGGASGAPVETSFTKSGPAPIVAVEQVSVAAGPVAFAPGLVFPGDREGKLNGSIRFSGPGVQAEYSLQGGPARSLSLRAGTSADQKLFDIPLPKGLAQGKIDIAVKATDTLGGTTEFRTFLFAGAEQAGAGVLVADGRLSDDGTIRLDERPLAGFVSGGPIQGVDLDPPTSLVRVETEGPVFRVFAAAPGTTAPTRLRIVAADGSSLATEATRFVTDLAAPVISVQSPHPGQWVSRDLALAGSVADEGGLALLEYSLDGGTYASVPTKPEQGAAAFSLAAPLGTLDDGPHMLALRATDAAGNAAVVQVPFIRDTLPPGIVFVAPRADQQVNGLTTIVGRIEDEGQAALVEVTEDGKSWREVSRGPGFRFDVNLTLLAAKPEALQVRATDEAGNGGTRAPQLALTLAADTPIAEVQLPGEGELLRDDFVLSGMVFDDDGVKAVYWRFDGGEFQRLEGGNNFSVPVSLDQISDNEHTVEVKAEDVGGLASAVVSRRFKVSRSDPVSSLDSPSLSAYVRGTVDLEGTSRDPNGIAEVRVSLDNGLSFYRAELEATTAPQPPVAAWKYRLDTRLIADGTQAVLVRAVDSTGAEGLFTTTINIDNGAPELVVDSPADGEVVSDVLTLGGRSVDTIGLASLELSVAPISAGPAAAADAAAKSLEATLPPGGILARQLDVRGLAPGWYNVQLDAADRAGNRSYVSRNFLKRAAQEAERVELVFPAVGERLAGPFTVSGRVVSQSPFAGKNALVLLDGQPLETAPISDLGWFSLEVTPDKVAEGDHVLSAEVVLVEGARLLSEQRRLQYAPNGPWVRVSSFRPGDYVTGRPFLKGTAGWAGDEAKKPPAGHAVRLVEVSTDNGRSFVRADGTGAWSHRLETQQLANGALRLLVKATFADGSTAVARTQLVVDTRAPVVTLIEPKEGDRFNETVAVMGTAADESGLQEVAASLREGDKSRYQVPSFIQGLYLDAHALGATYWDAGLGLTFFDNNVKLQVQLGMSPPGRFSGYVIGAKLLANIATVPFGYLLGPSWDFFSMALAVGANFSYFTMAGDSFAFTDAGLVLAGVLAQLEFARFHIESWRMFSDWALYTEYQLWFISSDVEAGTVGKLSFGMKVGLL